MKHFLFIFFWAILSTFVNAQELSASKLIDLVSMPVGKAQSILTNKKFAFAGTNTSGDTLFRIYAMKPTRPKNRSLPVIERRCSIVSLRGTSAILYETSSEAEFKNLLNELKKDGFYSATSDSTKFNLYQHNEYTAWAGKSKLDGMPIYQVSFFQKLISQDNMLRTAEDLLEFTSHEYLVHFFGEKNVKKDLYFFAENDIANCSVLFINTNRQVIFVWKDPVNRRKIANLLFGGQQHLQSQQSNTNVASAENSWSMKCGVRVGMPLVELRILNDNRISFCGGQSPNPGLVLPESTGKVDFSLADVVLGCVNCTDEKFLAAEKLNSDRALEDGRILFVLSIILYPVVNNELN